MIFVDSNSSKKGHRYFPWRAVTSNVLRRIVPTDHSCTERMITDNAVVGIAYDEGSRVALLLIVEGHIFQIVVQLRLATIEIVKPVLIVERRRFSK